MHKFSSVLNIINSKDFKLTRFYKIFGLVFFLFCAIIAGLLIYGSKTSEHEIEMKYTLNSLSPDSLNEILISPYNPNYKINLTLDTIKITGTKTISEITTALNQIEERYPGRVWRKGWEAHMTLKLKSGRILNFEVIDAEKGIDLLFLNTMLCPEYKCDKLKSIFERLANYKENLGNS